MASSESVKETRRTAPQEFLDSSLPIIDGEGVPSCVICGSEVHSFFAAGYDYEIRTCRNEWSFVKCQRCNHVWLNPRPAISALPVIYPKTYYAYCYDKISPIARAAKSWLDRSKLRMICSHSSATVRSFLDIGCGDGRFLDVMRGKGLDPKNLYGLELDEQVVSAVKARGYQAFCSRVEDCAEIAEGSIDLATMFHVIEHVDHPELVVRRIANWLAPGGILAIETPNLDSFDARLFGETFWGGYHIPRHWHLFYPETLARLLSENGLTPIATRFQTGHSFWMYSVHHALRYSSKRYVRLSRLFNPFKSVLPLALFTGFDKVRAALGFKTSAMLLIARKG